MCLAVPAQLIAVNDAIGTVELTGATRTVACSSYQKQGRGLAISSCGFYSTNC